MKGLCAVSDALATEFCHPCSPSLAFAREEVRIEKRKVAAVRILYLIDLHLVVIYRYIVKLVEGYAVKPCSKPAYRIYTVLKLEIWLEELLVQRVLLFLKTL